MQDRAVKDFILPESHPATPKNALSYFNHQIPHTTFCRKVHSLKSNTDFDLSVRETLQVELDEWFGYMPEELRHRTSWLGVHAEKLNLSYHYYRLLLMRTEFLIAIDHAGSNVENIAIRECQKSMQAILEINVSFLEILKLEMDDESSLFQKHCVFACGLFYCSLGGQGLYRVMDILIGTLTVITRGQSYSVLSECVVTPGKAIALLKTLK